MDTKRGRSDAPLSTQVHAGMVLALAPTLLLPSVLALASPPPPSLVGCCPLAPSQTLLKPLIHRRTFIHGCVAASGAVPFFLSPVSTAAPYLSEDNWYRFEGDGFALSVPPDFEDIMEPEEPMLDVTTNGNKSKPKAFLARFASPDRSEVVSVVTRPSAQLKLSFFSIKNVTDLGSLQDAASIFVPVGAKVYSERMIGPSDIETDRTYYYYEFATGDNYIAMQAAVSKGKVYVLGVTAPKTKWKEDYKKLRLAAASFLVY